LGTDRSGESFLFTLKNPHGVAPRRFPLILRVGLLTLPYPPAIARDAGWGPHFLDLGISDHCNVNSASFADFSRGSYRNDTGQEGKVLFAGSAHFTVHEIEVFEMREDLADA
jgi:hypothetical protein